MQRFFKALFLIFFSLTVLPAVCYSQAQTIVEGHVAKGEGKLIRVYGVSDYITNTNINIAQTEINSSGNFSFRIDLEPQQVLPVAFAIERYRSEIFYIEAGHSYFLKIDSTDFDSQDTPGLYLIMPENLYLKIPADTNELNFRIRQFNADIDRFTALDYIAIAKRKDRKAFQANEDAIRAKYAGFQHPFFQLYVEYSFAQLLLAGGIQSFPYLSQRYFGGRIFQYAHPLIMTMFNDMYDNYIQGVSRQIKMKDLDLCINREPDYKALLDSLGKDSLLKNEVLREMVLIKNLYQMISGNYFPESSVLNMLHEIELKSKFPQHRKIAGYIYNSYIMHNSPRIAPVLELLGTDSSAFSLEDMDKKYTYVLFYTSSCLPCNSNLKVLSGLSAKYSESINLLCVSLDLNFDSFKALALAYGNTLSFGNFNRNFRVEDDWRVGLVPYAVMLNSSFEIIKENAPLPDARLEAYFKGLLHLKTEQEY